MDPRARMAALRHFNQRLQQTFDSQEILRAWNVELSPNLVDISGRIIPPETILYGNNVR